MRFTSIAALLIALPALAQEKGKDAEDHHAPAFAGENHPLCLRRANTAMPTRKTARGSTTTMSQKSSRDCEAER